METNSMPKELFEALHDLEVGGSDANTSPAMIQILQDQGYVEMLDGVPTVTKSGLAALGKQHEVLFVPKY